MLDIRRLRLEPEAERDALVKRDPELAPIVEHVLSLDKAVSYPHLPLPTKA